MSIQRYQAFLATVKHKSLTKAASHLGYSQPSISQMIASLERELSIPLLVRTKNGVFPTADALLLIPLMEEIVSAEKALINQSFKIRGIEIGLLRVGAFLSVSSQWLPAIVSSYLLKHPTIDLQFFVGTNEELYQWLLDGKIDIAITADRIPDGFDFLPLRDDPIYAIISRKNSLSGQKIIDLKDLVKFPFIIPYESSDKKIEKILAIEKLIPKIRFRIKGGAATFSMINQDLGVTLTHKLAAMAELPGYSQVMAIPIKQHYSRTLGICVQPHRQSSFIEQSFIQEIEQYIQSMNASPESNK